MLSNTGYKLTHDKKLTIGYFGGSITEGAGQSRPGFCYRDRVTAWMKERYPEADITEIQAAIGGTGTDLGMYRCDRDLLSKNRIWFSLNLQSTTAVWATTASPPRPKPSSARSSGAILPPISS